MSVAVSVSPNGREAAVAGRFHTTRVNSLAAAVAWVRFYERMAARKSGRFYTDKLAAFRDVVRIMRTRQGEAQP